MSRFRKYSIFLYILIDVFKSRFFLNIFFHVYFVVKTRTRKI